MKRARQLCAGAVVAAVTAASLPAARADGPPIPDAIAAMERAAEHVAGTLSEDGLHAGAYARDLSVRRGKGGPLPEGAGLIMRPGMPGIGAAFLRLWEITGEERWRAEARRIAARLVDTQFLSGGWSHTVYTDPQLAAAHCYRRQVTAEGCARLRTGSAKNRSLLDDGITQEALLFLLLLQEADPEASSDVREAFFTGLEKVLDGQYVNGACPVRLPPMAPATAAPTNRLARLPAEWSRTWVKPDDPPYYITNDHLQRDCIRLFLAAASFTGEHRFLDAARRVGDFLLAAQLEEPGRGWAQTYDKTLVPVWGRRFEPPALASLETAGIVDALADLYVATGHAPYLEAAREGADWLDAVRLDGSRWARFYDLDDGRPLYVDDDYSLARVAGRDLLDGYAQVGTFAIPAVLRRVRDLGPEAPAAEAGPRWSSGADTLPADALANRARVLLKRQHTLGHWSTGGWIRMADFIEAVFVLARYVEEARRSSTARR